MIFSVLHGEANKIMNEVLPALNGNVYEANLASDLYSLIDRMKRAYNNYVNKQGLPIVSLTDYEIEKYAKYGLNPYYLSVISPITSLNGTEMIADVDEEGEVIVDPISNFPPPPPVNIPGIQVDDYIGIDEIDRDFIGQDYENSQRATALLRLIDESNAILNNSSIRYELIESRKDDSNTIIIIIIIGIILITLYNER